MRAHVHTPLSLAACVALCLGGACNAQMNEAPRTTVKTSAASAPVVAPDLRATASAAGPTPADTQAEADFLREGLVRDLALEVKDPRVLDAMRRVRRHEFMPNATLPRAYADAPWPIGYGQTISQPTVVAIMTEALELRASDRVLEIGTGSGYQAAILSVLCKEVFTIELLAPLGEEARDRLARLGYANVRVRIGDGYAGWPEHAPFDRIIVTAAPPEMPKALLDQLAVGGVLVAPVGPSPDAQSLYRYRKTKHAIQVENLGAVRFVPMVPEP
jgi:protein-L-isoaspartate(D-aspartate) O-methyltransferase